MKAAQSYLKEKKYTIPETDKAWTEETDELFFSRRKRGLASWILPIGSPIYYEFEGLVFLLTNEYRKLKNEINRLLFKVER